MLRGGTRLFSRGRGVGELCVVHDAHLFVLQIHTSSFGTSWLGEMASLFSVLCNVGRLSMD
jgi:hypothetical protein